MGEIVAFSTVLLLLLGAYWSLVVFPKQRAFRNHNRYVRTLHVGDEVITFGGIIGTLSAIDSDSGVAHVKIAEGVEIKVLTAALSRPYVQEEVAHSAQIGVEGAEPARRARKANV